jgi:hypothetical protein
MTETRAIELAQGETIIRWSEQARDEWARMANHVAVLASAYGPEHKYATEAAASFARIAGQLIGWGNVVVGRDGDLSLICHTVSKDGSVGMVFGLIFHTVRRSCTRKDCHAVINDGGKAWTFNPNTYPMCEDGQHVPSYPLDAPHPGTWSFHS